MAHSVAPMAIKSIPSRRASRSRSIDALPRTRNSNSSNLNCERRSLVPAQYYPDLKAEARAILRIEPCLTDTASPIAQAFADAVRTVRFNQPRFRGTTGFTDLHYFVNTGLPGVGYGPSGEGGHAINERVNIPDLVRTSAIYATFMTRAEL